MRIIIDMQGAQAPGSRNRGIGRYTFSLVQAILRQRGRHEIVLVLNGAFPEAAAWLREQFGALLPADNVRLWQPPGSIDFLSPGNSWRQQSAELLREAFLSSLAPDFVIVTSLFEGLSDDAATSVASLDSTTPTAVILYDLIPLIQRQVYLSNPVVENWYEKKLDALRRADLLLAISDSSRQEAIDYLGVEKGACVTISTAADAHFVPLQPSDAQARALRDRYGLHGSYVMYTGGIDHRKNINGLIHAFAALPPAVRAGVQLAIVCSIQDHHRIELAAVAASAGLSAGELVMTGYVPEDDLVLLYNLCVAFVFPSWHEGFGLPALEAMSCGRAVIAANSSSLPEVIGRSDALFDPHDTASIAGKLEQVLVDPAFRQSLEQHGLRQALLFSWDASAQRAIAAIENAHLHRRQAPAPMAPVSRPRLAFFAPLPPEHSGIADYSAELLPELSRYYRIDVVAPQGAVSDPWVRANCQLRNIDWFREHAGRYDRVLYHMGNSAFHGHMFDLIQEVPGVVVLHDFFLSGVLSYLEMTGADPGCWVAALYDSHGYPGVAKRFADDTNDTVLAYPCNLPILRAAMSVIVHSANSQALARTWYGHAAADGWHVIPHMRVPVQGVERQQARRALGYSDDMFVVCSFGLLGPSKLNHRLLKAWLSILEQDKACVLVFVGENAGGAYGAALLAAIAASPARDRITISGWADTALYRQFLASADVAVQLRTSSRGETSGTVLDCMNYGLPTIINAHGSLDDVPDDAVRKLENDFDDAALASALQALREDPAARARLGARARQLIQTVHAPRACAALYADAIETSFQRSKVGAASLLKAVARIDPPAADAQELAVFANAMARSMPPHLQIRQRLVEIDPAASPTGRAAETLAQALRVPSSDYRVELVYFNKQLHYARKSALTLLGCPAHAMHDEVADLYHGDTFVAMAVPRSEARAAMFRDLEMRGIHIEHASASTLMSIKVPA